MFKKLQERWKLKSAKDVFIALLVFAATGFTIARMKPFVLDLFPPVDWPGWISSSLYYILILPVYFLVLMIYGKLFGMGYFFIPFAMKTLRKIFPFLK